MRRAFLVPCLAAAAVAGCTSEPVGLEPGAPPPAQWATSDARPVVGWVLREDDFFTCDDAARDLRRLSRRYRGQVRFSVLVIGTDSAAATEFLRRARLTELEYSHVSPVDADRALGRIDAPRIAVIADGRIVATFLADAETVRRTGEVPALSAAVSALVGDNRAPT